MHSSGLQPSTTALLCPACGYDLRGSDSLRCPECGLEINRNALQTSAIPWAHRKSIGRARAYLKTVWQITRGSSALVHEAAKPQDPRDGAAFIRVTGALLAVLLLAMMIVLARETEAVRYPLLDPMRDLSFSTIRPPGWVLDVAVPWAAGVTLWPLAVVCLILFAFHVAGVQRTVFRSSDRAQRERAVALAAYTTAPLVLLVPAFALVVAAGYLFSSELDREAVFRWVSVFLGAVGLFFVPASIILTLWRVGRWFARVRHCGLGRATLAVAELLGLWIAGLFVILGVFPWCAGFGWIVIDSFRR